MRNAVADGHKEATAEMAELEPWDAEQAKPQNWEGGWQLAAGSWS